MLSDSEKKIILISQTIDRFLLDQVIEHEIAPLSLSSIFLARLVRLNRSAESEDELYHLFKTLITEKQGALH